MMTKKAGRRSWANTREMGFSPEDLGIRKKGRGRSRPEEAFVLLRRGGVEGFSVVGLVEPHVRLVATRGRVRLFSGD